VLLVEDNGDAGETLADILALAGHDVTLARSGGEGLALARHLRPDVVVSDIGVPDITGTPSRRRSAGIRRCGVPGSSLSGDAQIDDRNRAEEAGFDAHLAKPPDLDELLRVVSAPPPA